MAVTAPEDHHIDLDVVQARQGLRGRHAFIILVVSVTLTILTFIIAYAVNHQDLKSVNSAPTASAADAANSDAMLRPAQQ